MGQPSTLNGEISTIQWLGSSGEWRGPTLLMVPDHLTRVVGNDGPHYMSCNLLVFNTKVFFSWENDGQF